MKLYILTDSIFLKSLEDYTTSCQQKVFLNDNFSIFLQMPNKILFEDRFCSEFLFLIYVNDLPYGITSMCEVFVDDTYLFSSVNNKNISNTQLNSDQIKKISKWNF